MTSRDKKNLRASRKTAENKNVRDRNKQTDRHRQTRRDEADDEEDDERDEKDDDKDRLSHIVDVLVKKDINDYFAQSNNAADDEEVFDRSERAGTSPVSSGISLNRYL